MKTMSIKAKLSAGFGVILVILAVMGLVSYVSLQKLSGISTVEAEKAQARFLATSVHVSINDQKVAIRSYLLSSDESQLTKIETSKSAIAEDFTKLDEIVADSESKRLSAELRKQAEEYYVMCQETAQLHRAGKIKEATDLLFNPEHTALRSAIDKNMGEFVDLQDKLKNAVREEQLATESRTTLWIVGLAIIGVVVGAIVATFTGRAISGGIATMVGMIDELAANNLTVADMEITSQDEVGQAGIALNKMKNNLHAVIEAISGTSMHVATASEELSGDEPADHGQFRGDLGAGQRRLQRHRAGQPEPANRRHRRRRDGQPPSRKSPRTPPKPPRSPPPPSASPKPPTPPSPSSATPRPKSARSSRSSPPSRSRPTCSP